jgi:hypothetical protein
VARLCGRALRASGDAVRLVACRMTPGAIDAPTDVAVRRPARRDGQCHVSLEIHPPQLEVSPFVMSDPLGPANPGRDRGRTSGASQRSQWARIVLEMRHAPVHVHPTLDPAFERFRRETETGCAGLAIVLVTPLGRVRSDRLASTATSSRGWWVRSKRTGVHFRPALRDWERAGVECPDIADLRSPAKARLRAALRTRS